MPSEKIEMPLISLTRERVATYCICCNSNSLKKSPAILMPFIAHRVFDWRPVQIDNSWGLTTITNGMAYPLCNTLFCLECGFLFLDIRFSDSEMGFLYDGYREKKYTELREHYEPGYQERNKSLVAGINYLKKVEEFLSPFFNLPINILDWGGDTGKNSPFKDDNKVLHIYEINNKKPIDGAEIINKEQALKTDYDLIVCSHVLEHVSYPSELILEIKKVMKKKTVLYIEVPYETIMQKSDNKTDFYLKKRHWHEHINFYSEQSLRQLLTICGLGIIKFCQLEARGGANTSYILQVACKLRP